MSIVSQMGQVQNILILGMGGNVSQGIFKALKGISDINLHIIGACISETSSGLYLCDEAFISPYAKDESFIPWYIDICHRNNITMSFTGVEENIEALLKGKDRITQSVETKFIYPDQETWNIGTDKYNTCEWLKKNECQYPDYALASDDSEITRLIERYGFPLLAKPRKGKSSVGVIKINSLRDLKEILGRSDYILQEYIGDDNSEYTVGCYFNKTGELSAHIIMHRYLNRGGTSIAEVVPDNEISREIMKIIECLHATGPLNFQFRKRKDGTPVCFEWNVRYSGTTAIRNHFGFRDVEAGLREYLFNEDISDCFQIRSGSVVRYEEEQYFDNAKFIDLKNRIIGNIGYM